MKDNRKDESLMDTVKKGITDMYAQGYYHGVLDSSAGVHNHKLFTKGKIVDEE